MQQESPTSESTPASQHSKTASPLNNELDRHTKNITRRSHRKSRAGCKNCKTRRIKCDESKPHCGNCKRREVRCDFAVPVAAQSSHEADSSNAKAHAGYLPISEIELTYHFVTSTAHSISAWPQGGINWKTQTFDLGFEHPYILHLMFALTALHLARCRPRLQEQYVATADHHYEHGLALVTLAIANINPDNCDAIYFAVQSICFINWARGPQPGEYLAFGKGKRSDWLAMFRGIRTTVKSIGTHHLTKTHGPAIRAKGRPLPTQEPPEAYKKQLDDLRGHVDYISKLTPTHEGDIKAVDVLREMYDNRYRGRDGEYHVVFGWLYRMTEDFLERLQECDVLPLIIYAHFVVLMSDMERFWYAQGWTHHVMSGIFDALEMEHRTWIRWPMAQVGWIEP